MSREWEADAYDSMDLPHSRWQGQVAALCKLSEDSVFLDVGCGPGVLTQALLQRFPSSKAFALDRSVRMVDQAKARLKAHEDRVTYLVSDVSESLPVADGSLDAIVSSATLHWVSDHERLFPRFRAALKPGGSFIAQWGGEGNLAEVVQAVEAAEWSGPPIWNFSSVAATRRLLQLNGFAIRGISLAEDVVSFEDQNQLLEYLRVVILGAHLSQLGSAPAQLDFLRSVAARLPRTELRYVRLTVDATLVDVPPAAGHPQ